MNTGGFAFGPSRTGACAGTDVETITRSLVESKGAPYDTGTGSLSWLECHAVARALAAMYSAQRRFKNQFDPLRMTDSLARWEKGFGLPSYGRTFAERRAEVALRFSMIGRPPVSGELTQLLQDALPDSFDAIVYCTSANANTHTPTSVTVPGGITTVGDSFWSSSIARVSVKLVQPAWQTQPEFARATGVVHRLLDTFLPTWAIFNWFKDGAHGIGFYLDENNNLDNQRFA